MEYNVFMVNGYRKGFKGYFVKNWDSKGTVSITPITITACGEKRMTLVNSETGQLMGRNFNPGRDQNGIGGLGLGLVITDSSECDKVEEIAIDLAGKIIAQERAGYARCLANNSASAGYKAAIQKELDAIHEERVLWRSTEAVVA